MPNGTVKKIVAERGFGFIKPDRGEGGGKRGDVFFHVSELPTREYIDEMAEGDRVSFELATGEDGRARASSVRPL